jgi:hypothetical protein
MTLYPTTSGIFLVEKGLIYLAPVKLNPTWQNKRIGDDIIEKRLDRFLIFDKLLEHPLQFRKWIGSRGESNHSPIFLEVFRRDDEANEPLQV